VSTRTVLSRLDGESVARWVTVARDALEEARAEIDELNVYPVPDGDTGTNLHLTLVAAVESLTAASLKGEDTETPTPRRLMSALAHGALMGARGNSGVILAQLLRGVADGLDGVNGSVDAPELAHALTAGAKAAYEAVADPVEGRCRGGPVRCLVRRCRHPDRRRHGGRQRCPAGAGPDTGAARGAAPRRGGRRRWAWHLRAPRRPRLGRDG
jgi:hypothetical protein